MLKNCDLHKVLTGLLKEKLSELVPGYVVNATEGFGEFKECKLICYD